MVVKYLHKPGGKSVTSDTEFMRSQCQKKTDCKFPADPLGNLTGLPMCFGSFPGGGWTDPDFLKEHSSIDGAFGTAWDAGVAVMGNLTSSPLITLP